MTLELGAEYAVRWRGQRLLEGRIPRADEGIDPVVPERAVVRHDKHRIYAEHLTLAGFSKPLHSGNDTSGGVAGPALKV
jgi:hypothetical protein